MIRRNCQPINVALYESALTPASGKIFASLPATAILAVDFSLKGGALKAMTNPDMLAMQLSLHWACPKKRSRRSWMNSRRRWASICKPMCFDLMNGDAGLAVMVRDQQKSDAMSYSMPIEFAVLLDSSDANQLMGSFDKIVQGLSTLSP